MGVKGADKHLRRLRQMYGERVIREVGAAIYAAADYIRTEAALSITRGSVSGRGHVASKPGEPPNRDTGHLDSSIVVTRTGPVSASISANAPHAKPLEFGTSKMAARPFMRPAASRGRRVVTDLVTKAIQRANRGG